MTVGSQSFYLHRFLYQDHRLQGGNPAVNDAMI